MAAYKKCEIHDKELTSYCADCRKMICIYCLKNNNSHMEHKIKYILDMMPSTNEINSLKERIKEKSKIFKKLIILISNWQKKLNRKINK